MTGRRWVPVTGVVVAVGLVAAVAAVLAGTRGSGSPSAGPTARPTARNGVPPVLHLADDPATPTGTGLITDTQGAAGTRRYRTAGMLPTGPAKAAGRLLPAGVPEQARVATLAAALGLVGRPVRRGDGWVLGRLTVTGEPGQPWTLAGPAPAGSGATTGSVGSGTAGGAGSPPDSGTGSSAGGTAPGSSGGGAPVTGGGVDVTGDGVTVPTGGPLPVAGPRGTNKILGKPQGAPVDERAARAAAAPVLAALGLSGGSVRVERPLAQPGADTATVLTEPRVDGRDTSGFTTWLMVDRAGKVVAGEGHLDDGRPGPAYPLRTAAQALAGLPAPQGLPDCRSNCPAVAESLPLAVTGARLGLAPRRLQDGSGVLLPVWLFTLDGSADLLVADAVQERFLAYAVDAPRPPAAATEQPLPLPAAPADAVESVTVGNDDRTLRVTTYHGVCPDVPNVVTADETSARVVLRVRRPKPAAGVCIALAKSQTSTVRLRAPLASRTVVAWDGRTLVVAGR